MVNLKGKNIYLRALEPEDLEFLYRLENDSNLWEISGTVTPYSRQVLKLYLENAYRDIYDVKQLRLAICNEKDKTVGLIDLFEFDPRHRRAGMGIVVADEKSRNKGIGTEAIQLLCAYAFGVLELHQIYANVAAENKGSIALFERLGFKVAGTKKEWLLVGGAFKDELILQKIRS